MQGYLVISGSPTVQNLISFNRLVDWGERERSQQEIVAGLAPEMAQVAGLRAFAANHAPPGQSIRSPPAAMVIQARQPNRDLAALVAKLLATAAGNPRIIHPATHHERKSDRTGT